MNILKDFKSKFFRHRTEEMTLEEYLELVKKDSSVYASSAERLLKAIGEPKLVNTAEAGAELGRIFQNKVIKLYDSFSDFYGMEEIIEHIVGFLKHAAQGLEESKQILYLLGPVGSAKSSLAERLKKLMEQEPIYVLKAGNDISPINESPLGLLDTTYAAELGISERHLRFPASPWAQKRLDEFEGDLTRFTVVKKYPNVLYQDAISKTEPSDENNQDVSSLVGRINIRKLEYFDQDDPDAYSYSGGLCKANQGLLEFVEMFKAPQKTLHPLLTATQEGNYKGTEFISAIPFEGIVLAHSNETEWQTFKNQAQNEAFIDRICVVKVPYNLRYKEEINIYKKIINSSELKGMPCAPRTLELLSKFIVMSRLKVPENSDIYNKMRIYNGDSMKEKDIKVKSYAEYRDQAGVMEGMNGISTRFAFKVLSQVFNYDSSEIAANPAHLFVVLKESLRQESLNSDTEVTYLDYLKKYLEPEFALHLEKDIQVASIESYAQYGQAVFDKYIKYADHWVQDNDFRDVDTGQLYNREQLDKELSAIEKACDISNPKDFRNEVVNFAIRYRANNKKNLDWREYAKLKIVIEKYLIEKTDSLMPMISFDGSGGKEEQKKSKTFIHRMIEQGYTEKQVRLLYEWHQRYKTGG